MTCKAALTGCPSLRPPICLASWRVYYHLFRTFECLLITSPFSWFKMSPLLAKTGTKFLIYSGSFVDNQRYAFVIIFCHSQLNFCVQNPIFFMADWPSSFAHFYDQARDDEVIREGGEGEEKGLISPHRNLWGWPEGKPLHFWVAFALYSDSPGYLMTSLLHLLNSCHAQFRFVNNNSSVFIDARTWARKLDNSEENRSSQSL